MPAQDGHQFGGQWTSRKLGVLSNYLQSYGTALKNQPFKRSYIDAFAGTGTRLSRKLSLSQPLFAEEVALLAGSAKCALECMPPFDRYIFIEKSANRCRQLERLKLEFPQRAEAIDIRHDDANRAIQGLCRSQWTSDRAVLFLDPYGMQVEWATVEAIARTQAIDLWYLFPLGIGVNRLVTQSGDIPPRWAHRLDVVLGTPDWRGHFYEHRQRPDLFGALQDDVVKKPLTTIGLFVRDRLAQIFAGVAKPGVIRNSTGSPMYELLFAVGNPRGRDIALRIANHLLKGML